MFASICPADGPDQAFSIQVDHTADPLWQRVAVCSLWQNADIVRKRWPHAAVVAPCRTLLGVDYLLRDLLANPQIRVLVIDGVDLSPGKATSKTLFDLWKPREDSIASLPLDTQLLRKQEAPDAGRKLGPGDAVFEALCLLFHGTRVPGDGPGVQLLARMTGKWEAENCTLDTIKRMMPAPWDADRVGHAILPPPPPKAEAPAPPGDPGERVVGDTLDVVYAGVLRAAMSFGSEVETQYGPTRELLNLVSVVRDPQASLAALRPNVEDLARLLHAPGNVMHDREACPDCNEANPVLGFSWRQLADYTYSETGFLGRKKPEDASYGYGQRMHGGCDDPQHPEWADGANQIYLIEQLLQRTPGTRAAYITPWWPDDDAGQESGRPCLVGAWFRAIPKVDKLQTLALQMIAKGQGRSMDDMEPESEGRNEAALTKLAREATTSTLHLTVAFRSHDLFGGYANNLGACSHWLVDTAQALGMQVGTITCVSYSAHIYKKDWDRALEVAQHRAKGIPWDQRSTWRIEVVKGAPTGASSHAIQVGDAQAYAPGSIRAIALTPDGNKVLDVFAGVTAAAVMSKIEKSGLVTSIGNAMWLGGELMNAEGRIS